MKAPDQNPLLQDVLVDEELRALRSGSLNQVLEQMRRQRQRRRVARTAVFVVAPLLLLLASLVWGARYNRSVVGAVVAGAKQESALAEPSPVENISDEELFALFPNRALALIGTPGRQQLVFLDERVHN